MASESDDSYTGRTGPSFGITLIPKLIHHHNPLFDASAPPLPSPDITGKLASSRIKTLYQITLYAQTKWATRGHNALDVTVFTNFINYKTTLTPSYYTAYEQALTLYQELVKKLGSEDKAMDFLYTPSPHSPPMHWEVVRNWVIKEFLRLFVVSGNFRVYGWLNFPGWMGAGPFNDPNHLPYRGMKNGA